ncbi:ATP-binding protein [Leifsonia shinshuensis]|uniref:PqqD family peptide modification chaperone n=1 Tax=Leifsonia shinshuensis TaxID=150026 RepID=A0A7G6YA17_9MICO|nr:ATP-binding protein [Leifsonia shinshuensis]QNE35332.1 hypothetical protein F1C12_09455 [Leifsonia shinshuensis]
MPAHPPAPHETDGGFVVGALGRRVRVRISGAGADTFAAAFAGAWAHLLLGPDGGSDTEVTVGAATADADTIAVALANASALITRALIDLNTGRRLMLHAGAAVGPDGRAILLVGPSGAGKTTAITRLAGAHGYLTDETAFVDADGIVLPYPKPLSVDRGGPAKAQLTPAGLGLRDAEGPHEVARVIVLDRDAGTPGRPRSRRLDLVESLRALVPQISSLQHHPSPLRAIAELIRRVGGIELLGYPDARDLDPIAGPPEPPRLSAEELAFTAVDCGRSDHASAASGLLRTPAGDALVAGDLLVLAHGNDVRVLAGVAKTIWLATAEARSEADLLELLRDAYGAAPGDESALCETVDVLLNAGVLEWRT